MAKRPQMTLDALKAAKPCTLRPAVNRASTLKRGQTLRLDVDQWKRLKILAANEEKTCHALLIEALDLLFQDRGLPPIAWSLPINVWVFPGTPILRYVTGCFEATWRHPQRDYPSEQSSARLSRQQRNGPLTPWQGRGPVSW